MILKKMIGNTLKDLGFVTQTQLDEALKKQKQIFKSKILPEKLNRTQLISEARFSGETSSVPFLGEILTEMGHITRRQLQKALKSQGNDFEKYCSLKSNTLCSVMDLGTLVNSSLNLVEVLDLILENTNEVTHSTASTLMLLDEKTGDLVFSVPTGPNAKKLIDIRIKRGQGIAGWVVEHEKSVLVPDVKKDPRFYSEIDNSTGFETKSILAVPMKVKNKLIGVLEVINKKNGSAFTEEDELLLVIFASHAAMAIENARLYSELRDRLEDEKNLHRKLAEANKILALGQMASGVAHDFNNILGAIMGYSEMTMIDMPQNHVARHNLSQILKASHRAKDVVQQILAYTRKHELERKVIDLKEVTNEALKFIRASIPSTIEIRAQIPKEPCIITANATMIHQIIMNLCTNAHHAMLDQAGILSLSLECLDLRTISEMVDDDLKPGRYIKLSVADTGIGMPPEIIDRIFDPYFTTKEIGVGTGLGLSVVQGIVKSHNGAIKVDSKSGNGTTFDIFLPSVGIEQAIEVEDHQYIPHGNERILFVDDEELLVELGKQMLKHLGYSVVATTDPQEALKLFEKEKDAIDLIITDLTMPNMTGDILVKKILQIKPNLPIIMCTGFSESIDQKRVVELGIRSLLEKPIQVSDMANTIRKFLDENKR